MNVIGQTYVTTPMDIAQTPEHFPWPMMTEGINISFLIGFDNMASNEEEGS
jgi:hypothetical protein